MFRTCQINGSWGPWGFMGINFLPLITDVNIPDGTFMIGRPRSDTNVLLYFCLFIDKVAALATAKMYEIVT